MSSRMAQEMSSEQVIELVQKYLDGRDDKAAWTILSEGVRQDGDWWYVPLTRNPSLDRASEYYAALAEIEQEIEEAEAVNLLLVPAA